MLKQRSSVYFLLSLLLVATSFSFVPAQVQTGTIVVKVIAFRSGNGHIQLSLYDKAADFPKVDVRMEMARTEVINSSVTEVVFENIPFGTYAIAGMHDENSNGEMDYNFVGIPKEGYCFSNDAKPILSPPSFKKAKFDLNQKKKVLYVAMQY